MIDPNLKNAKILIVDDQIQNVEVLEDFLFYEGYTNVRSTIDSREVINLYNEFKPDLLLLDLKMPHLSGYDVMEKLRIHISPRDFFPILVLTADVTDEAKKQALSGGATDFLTKPFGLTEVGLRIKNLLYIAFLQQQLKNQNVVLEEKVRERTAELEKKNNDLIRAKEKAEESDRLKSAFLANVSHEIRTPMNGILGFADLLKHNNLNPADIEEYISIIEKSGKRMLDTLNDLMDISKIEAGIVEVSKSEFDLNAEVDYINNFMQPEALKKNLKLIVRKNSGNEKLLIRTDLQKLEAVLLNLLKNAFKFTHEGNIEFGYVFNNGTIEFFVKDTGIGISKDRQKAIFDRFVQADLSLTKPHEGAGLGLSIAKGYVELLGGDLWVESEEGKGSIFTFTIPRSNASIEISDSKQEKNQGNPVNLLANLSVLVAEDDDINRMYLATLLDGKCKKVYYAVNGKEAVECYRENMPIDLVLMDLKMPVMDGYTATIKIRELDENACVIAQTAYVLASDRERAKAAGFFEFLTKPLLKDKLMTVIEKKFERK